MFCKDASGKGSDKGYMMVVGTNVCSHTGHSFCCDAWGIANVCSYDYDYSDFVVEL